MIATQEKPTGTKYTMTVALLMVALILSPAVLIISRPISILSISLAAACSMACLAMAWFNWKKHSELTILSIVSPRVVPK